jgi:hypothetical protein
MVVGAGRGPLVRASLQVSVTSLGAYELNRKKKDLGELACAYDTTTTLFWKSIVQL